MWIPIDIYVAYSIWQVGVATHDYTLGEEHPKYTLPLQNHLQKQVRDSTAKECIKSHGEQYYSIDNKHTP